MAVCTLDVTTRAELKAAVDACVGDRLCEMTMPHWDVSRVTDMSFLFQGKSQFNVDISQWEMSQVTTAAGMFEGAASFYRDISGWTFADNANTTGMFTGADTWLSRDLARMALTRRTVHRALGSSTRAWRTNASRSELCAPCPAAGPEPPGDDPALGVDTGCDVSRPCCAEGRGGQLHRRRSTGVACCSHGADCGAAGTVEMAGLGRVAGDEHERACSTAKDPSTRIYRDGTPRASRPCTGCSECRGVQPRYRYMGHLERHDHVRDVLRGLRVQPAPIEMGRQLGHDHAGDVLRRQRIQHDAGGLGHIQSHGFYDIFYSADAWNARFTGGSDDTLPGRGWTRKDNACDASLPPVNGAVGNCTDTLVSGTSCVPDVRRRVRAGGRDVVHRPGADRGCVYPGRHHQGRAQGGGGRVRRRSARARDHAASCGQVVAAVRPDMSFAVCQGMSQFKRADISQWEMSQVTTRGYVRGRLQLLPDISGGPSPTTPTRRGCSRAPTPGSRVLSRTTGSTRRMVHRALGSSTRAWRTNASRTECARPAPAAGPEPPEMIPQLGVDTGCTFPDSAALKAAVDNCIAVDPTGVACCSHGADCGAAGTVEMPDWDVSLVTRHEQLVLQAKDPSTRIYRGGTPRASRPCERCSRRHAFNQHLSRWDVSSVTTMQEMFYDANAFNTMPVGWDTSKVTDSDNILLCNRMVCEVHGRRRRHPPRAGGRASTTRATRPSAPQRRRRHLHRHPRERHVLRPHVRPRVRAGGRDVVHRPGTDRGCVYPGRHHQGRAQGGGGRVRRRSAVRADHAPLGRLARDGHELPVPGQVTIQRGHQPVGDVAGDDARVCFRAPPASTGTSRVGPSPTTRTRRGCSRAPTPGSRSHRERRARHDGWTAGSIGSSTRAWRTNASRTDCARPAPAAGPEPPEMIPHSVSTPGARFPTVLR